MSTRLLAVAGWLCTSAVGACVATSSPFGTDPLFLQEGPKEAARGEPAACPPWTPPAPISMEDPTYPMARGSDSKAKLKARDHAASVFGKSGLPGTKGLGLALGGLDGLGGLGGVQTKSSKTKKAPPPPEAPSPRRVKQLKAIAEVRVSETFACARSKNGHVYCWGDNTLGQLGDGTIINRTVPTKVKGLSKAASLTVGQSFACAATKSGAVRCWGDNTAGQLGSGNKVPSSLPVQVKGLTAARQVAAGHQFACATEKNGHVRCWGNNTTGQLGNDTRVDSATPVLVHGITEALGLALGTNFGCAHRYQGDVLCWGGDMQWFGRQEVDEYGDAILSEGGHVCGPALVVGMKAHAVYTSQGSAGYDDICVLSQSYGENGDFKADCWLADRTQFGAMGGQYWLNDWAGLAELSLSGQSCARHRTGIVLCKGPHARDGEVVKGVKNARQISTGGFASCAVVKNGSVLCWNERQMP